MPQGISNMSVRFLMASAAFLLAASLRAGTSAPVGMLQSEGSVYLGKATVSAASVVYAGDRLRTTEGRATVNFSACGFMVLGANSEASLKSSPAGLVIDLEKGQLALATSSANRVRVETDGLTFNPADSFPSLAEVSRNSDGSVAVSVHRGVIATTNLRPEPVLVRAGQILNVGPRVRQTNQGQAEPPGTGAHGKPTLGEKLRTMRLGSLSHNATVAIVVAGVAVPAAVGIGLANREEAVSPSAP